MADTESRTQVAVVRIDRDPQSAFLRAVDLVGGMKGLNSPDRQVTIKVGVFDHRSRHHPSVEAVQAIASAFDQAPSIQIAESDNYCGKALERLQYCYGELFNERVIP